MTSEPQQAKTTLDGTNVTVYKTAEPMMYFHPDSGTILCVDAAGEQALDQEHNFLTDLLQKQMAAQNHLDEAQFDSLSLALGDQRLLQKNLEAIYARLNQANQALRSELSTLTDNAPTGVMLDEKMKGSAIGLMELIPLVKGSEKGFKMTYVRSDKIKNHWRRYQLSNADKKSGQSSFVRYQEETIKVYEKRNNKVLQVEKTVQRARIDVPELKKQLTTLETSYKHKWELVPDTHEILTEWAEEMNKFLTWPKESENPEQKEGEPPAYHKYVDLSAQAQLMRYSQGVGAQAEFNPLHKKVVGKVAGHSSFALGEAKAVATFYMPDRFGVQLQFPSKNQGLCTMGALRFPLSAVLSGNVGASVAIELGVHLDWSGDIAKGYGIKGRPAKLVANGLPGARSINLLDKLEEPDSKVGGEIGAFVGAQAGANLGGAIEWYDPHPELTEEVGETSCKPKKVIHPKERQFKTIAKLEVGVGGMAGGGGGAVFYVTYSESRFRIHCKAALCWGVGAKGNLGFEVDGDHFSAFMKSFMFMLRNVDYRRLEEIIEPYSYQALCAIPLIMAARGVQAVDAMLVDRLAVLEALESQFKKSDSRFVLMKSVLDNPDQLRYTPPETKGAIIAQLIGTNWIDWVDRRNHGTGLSIFGGLKWEVMKERKKAIIATFKWVQSKADYRNVMQHLSETPGNGKGDFFSNEKRVFEFLGRAEVRFIDALSTQYEMELRRIYEELPAWIGDVEPFIPMPKNKIDHYFAMIEEQYSQNTDLA
ncbi:MAG: hypothetical protein ACOH2R_01725 [Pseudomonas sp.]